MKKILLFAVLLFSTVSVDAQLLWRISGNGCKDSSYLFGTYHYETFEFIPKVPGLIDAIQNVDVIYGEVNIEDFNTLPSQDMSFQHAPADSTIDKLFAYKLLTYEDCMKADLMLSINCNTTLEQKKFLKPKAITETITMALQKEYITNKDLFYTLDMGIQEIGRNRGIESKSLETVDDQLDVIKAMYEVPIIEQAEELAKICRDFNDFAFYYMAVVAAYQSQNFNIIRNIFFNSKYGYDEDNPEAELLFYKRNRNWMEKITQILPNQRALIVVGVGHFFGEDGLLNMLEEKGYTVEPVIVDNQYP
ncbi:MAG: TraB/GumN family protein [Muribaculaceae bacterium]|nr:TraB/GumN family protein [Muribaculaceae bacterium]